MRNTAATAIPTTRLTLPVSRRVLEGRQGWIQATESGGVWLVRLEPHKEYAVVFDQDAEATSLGCAGTQE